MKKRSSYHDSLWQMKRFLLGDQGEEAVFIMVVYHVAVAGDANGMCFGGGAPKLRRHQK